MMDRRQTTPIRLLALVGSIALAVAGQSCVECRPRETSGSVNSGQLGEDNSVSAVIPSPNQDFGDESATPLAIQELVRRSSATSAERGQLQFQPQQAASNLVAASTPIYASPFARSERVARAAVHPAAAAPAAAVAPIQIPMPIPHPLAASAFERRESSHAQANFAPRPSLAFEPKDLKAAASYGHHHHGGGHHGGGGYGSSGWLDMGAWTGGKGSFGWYADYPVGGKHGYGYGGRK